jgi:hypothetical protein
MSPTHFPYSFDALLHWYHAHLLHHPALFAPAPHQLVHYHIASTPALQTTAPDAPWYQARRISSLARLQLCPPLSFLPDDVKYPLGMYMVTDPDAQPPALFAVFPRWQENDVGRGLYAHHLSWTRADHAAGGAHVQRTIFKPCPFYLGRGYMDHTSIHVPDGVPLTSTVLDALPRYKKDILELCCLPHLVETNTEPQQQQQQQPTATLHYPVCNRLQRMFERNNISGVRLFGVAAADTDASTWHFTAYLELSAHSFVLLDLENLAFELPDTSWRSVEHALLSALQKLETHPEPRAFTPPLSRSPSPEPAANMSPPPSPTHVPYTFDALLRWYHAHLRHQSPPSAHLAPAHHQLVHYDIASTPPSDTTAWYRARPIPTLARIQSCPEFPCLPCNDHSLGAYVIADPDATHPALHAVFPVWEHHSPPTNDSASVLWAHTVSWVPDAMHRNTIHPPFRNVFEVSIGVNTCSHVPLHDGVLLPMQGYDTPLFNQQTHCKEILLDMCRLPMRVPSPAPSPSPSPSPSPTVPIRHSLERMLHRNNVSRVRLFGVAHAAENQWHYTATFDLSAHSFLLDAHALSFPAPDSSWLSAQHALLYALQDLETYPEPRVPSAPSSRASTPEPEPPADL